MPWRAPAGQTSDPYAVWLSEIMLQQTTVAAVKPYFEKFLKRWPTVADLAAAKSEDVMAAWAGLGYYARARNLHKCAQVIAHDHGGRFPNTEEELLNLPGVGPYTAAAIAAIAFNRRAVVVDGNVERVMARLHAITDPLPPVKPKLKSLAGALTPNERTGDYAQAVMDLGATVCTPKSPACTICPWMSACEGRKQGIAAELPRKLAQKEIPTRRGVVFWAVNSKNEVALIRRPPKGLLGGMLAFPTTDWRGEVWGHDEALAFAPVKSAWAALPGVVEHTFTHFHLELEVWVGVAASPKNGPKRNALNKDMQSDGPIWTPVPHVKDAGLPNVMQKVVRHAMSVAPPPRKAARKKKVTQKRAKPARSSNKADLTN
ncbi:MAG: A/G-specific adenine glycosylase [Rhodospirillaceae bacterium]|nr:A/G-specific adenine glycosylase [Rhodospirillaceae bacterium]